MPGGIFEALGAALQRGGSTYTALKEQESQQAERQKQLDTENQFRQQQLQMQQEQQAAAQKERDQRVLLAAIEGVAPGKAVDPSLVASIKAKAPELMSRIGTTKAGDMTPAAGYGLGMGMGGMVPSLEDSYTRNPSQKETFDAEDQELKKNDVERKNILRTHMTSPEHAKESFDQQVSESMANGLGTPPMSATENDRRKELENKQRMKELSIMYPPDRFGGKGGAETPEGKLKLWLGAHNAIEDNVRQKYASELQAYSRADADGDPQAGAKLAAVHAKIAQETDALTTQMLGPNPLKGVGGAGASGADAPPPANGGDQQLEQFLKDNAANIAADPKGFMREVQNHPGLSVDAKKAILARLMSQSQSAAPAGPNPTQSSFSPGSSGAGGLSMGAPNLGPRATPPAAPAGPDQAATLQMVLRALQGGLPDPTKVSNPFTQDAIRGRFNTEGYQQLGIPPRR